eukprot:1632492-Prymnesium_polylepis.1
MQIAAQYERARAVKAPPHRTALSIYATPASLTLCPYSHRAPAIACTCTCACTRDLVHVLLPYARRC